MTLEETNEILRELVRRHEEFTARLHSERLTVGKQTKVTLASVGTIVAVVVSVLLYMVRESEAIRAGWTAATAKLEAGIAETMRSVENVRHETVLLQRDVAAMRDASRLTQMKLDDRWSRTMMIGWCEQLAAAFLRAKIDVPVPVPLEAK